MEPDQLAGLIDFGSHLLDQAERKSRGLKDCNGSILKINALYRDDKASVESALAQIKPAKKVADQPDLAAMTKRAAALINGHTSGQSHYSAWFESPCKIRFQYDAQNQNKKPVSKRGVMDLTTGDLWAEDSKSSYRIITLKYKTEPYDIDLYLSGAFYKKVGNFMVFAMNNDKRHDITQDILELKTLLPDLAKRCKAQKTLVNP